MCNNTSRFFEQIDGEVVKTEYEYNSSEQWTRYLMHFVERCTMCGQIRHLFTWFNHDGTAQVCAGGGGEK